MSFVASYPSAAKMRAGTSFSARELTESRDGSASAQGNAVPLLKESFVGSRAYPTAGFLTKKGTGRNPARSRAPFLSQ